MEERVSSDFDIKALNKFICAKGLPKENTLHLLRYLCREVLGSMYDTEAIDLLWKYLLKYKLSIKANSQQLNHPMNSSGLKPDILFLHFYHPNTA